MLGYRQFGSGYRHVILIHDWFSDTTSYDAMMPYMNTVENKYTLVDLRGYGKSKSISGECTLMEAAHDILRLIDHLKMDKVFLVGHSMSGQIVQYFAAKHADRVHGFVAIAPVPPAGASTPEDVLGFLEDAAKTNDDSARQIVHFMTGQRYSETIVALKLKQWRDTSLPEARAGYLHMYTQTDISMEVQGCDVPALIVACAFDAPSCRKDILGPSVLPFFKQAEMVELYDCGHYPMQESPWRLASLIDGFIDKCNALMSL
jgi:pimeloyl-ACP methyl ester carboxylesterase